MNRSFGPATVKWDIRTRFGDETDLLVSTLEQGRDLAACLAGHRLVLMSPLETLRAATSVPAARLGLSDLLLVQGDPTVSVDDSLNVVRVWRRGQPVETGGRS